MKKIKYLSIAIYISVGTASYATNTINICANNSCQGGNMYAQFTSGNPCYFSDNKKRVIEFTTTDAFDGWHTDGNTYGNGPKNFTIKYSVYQGDTLSDMYKYGDNYRCGGTLKLSCDSNTKKIALDCLGNITTLDMPR